MDFIEKAVVMTAADMNRVLARVASQVVENNPDLSNVLLVGPTGSVLGVELEPELVSFGSANLARTDRPWAAIRQAEAAVLGDPDGAPYDRVLVSAMADAMPVSLVEQLTEDGVLVVPVDGTMLRVTNPGAVVTAHGRYRFVPLR